MSQSALSEQIADLERELGVPLFDRSERKLRLTAHGEIFLRESNKVLDGSEHAVALARRSFRGEVGTLRIGFFAGGVGARFAELIRQFRTDRPEVQVSLTEMRPGAQTQALLDASIDVAFTRRVEEPFARELRSEILRHHRLDAVLPENHRLAKKSVDIRKLSNTLVIFTSDSGGGGTGPLRGGKTQMFEGGHRVPMIARWPGRIPKGAVHDDLTTTLEFFPTLLAAAGARPPPSNSMASICCRRSKAKPHVLARICSGRT